MVNDCFEIIRVQSYLIITRLSNFLLYFFTKIAILVNFTSKSRSFVLVSISLPFILYVKLPAFALKGVCVIVATIGHSCGEIKGRCISLRSDAVWLHMNRTAPASCLYKKNVLILWEKSKGILPGTAQ